MAAGAMAQGQGQPAAPFMVHQLKPNVYWIEGGGGNSGVIVGDKGVIVIDAKTTRGGREGTAGRYREDHAQAGHHRHSHAQRRRSREWSGVVPGRHHDHRAREQ